MNKALILSGTNAPSLSGHLDQAAERMISSGIHITKRSSYYKSPPWGFTSKNEFLNQVLMIETEMDPFQLMKRLLAIETEMGRNRTPGAGYEDRLIDLDILFYNKEVINSETLIVPHPRMQLRRFALLPCAEIAGNWIHPVLRVKVTEMLENCEDRSEVIKVD